MRVSRDPRGMLTVPEGLHALLLLLERSGSFLLLDT